jgi:hypothetical protein
MEPNKTVRQEMPGPESGVRRSKQHLKIKMQMRRVKFSRPPRLPIRRVLFCLPLVETLLTRPFLSRSLFDEAPGTYEILRAYENRTL